LHLFNGVRGKENSAKFECSILHNSPLCERRNAYSLA
jgi:hypothetical protein